MLKTIMTVAAFYCLAVLCSCQKEVSPVTDPPTDTTATSESYIPLSAGTFWVYKDSANSTYDTATVLSEKWLHDDINFTKVELASATDTSSSYYGIKDHNYYLYGEQNGITLTMLVLNDTTSVGNGWVYDMGTINGVPARGTGTVMEKNITYTEQGETYDSVIHTQYVLAYNIVGTYTDFATYDFYFAKGVGVIKVQSSLTDITGGGNNMLATQDLVDYDVK
jgi:hypothetical protein